MRVKALPSGSQFCAPCHSLSFWGTPIYQSFDEWLKSPYAAEGVQCQNCHMAPTGQTHFVLLESAGQVEVKATLIFRRLFQPLAEVKG